MNNFTPVPPIIILYLRGWLKLLPSGLKHWHSISVYRDCWCKQT